jgi:hypothetical protein
MTKKPLTILFQPLPNNVKKTIEKVLKITIIEEKLDVVKIKSQTK